MRRRWGPTIPTWPPASTTWPTRTNTRGGTPRPSRSSKRALAIREKALGPDHPDVAASLNNLATLYIDQGRYAEAEPLLKRALAIREKALGPDHPDVAQSLHNLAVLYQVQGRYAEAEPLYKRALAIKEKALGHDHPDVATSLNNLADAVHGPGPVRRGRAALQAGAGDQREGARARPPRRGHEPQQPGRCCTRNQGRYAEAEPLYKRALAIREKALGPNHSFVASSLNRLASIYQPFQHATCCVIMRER